MVSYMQLTLNQERSIMNKTKGLLLTAGFVLATAFTFSCSGDDGGGGGGDPSSSSGGGTQGGGDPSSSSNGGQGGGNACTNLEEVPIGTQVWAKKNLDCDVGESKCYDNDPANCTKYGRLYDWETAKTACPSGWHLPSQADWEVMTAYIGGAETEGTKLKATSGWDYQGNSGNGTDGHGFTALPGGLGNFANGELSVGSFTGVGGGGAWWSSNEHSSGSSFAYGRLIRYNQEDAEWESYPKAMLLSVRCIKD
jgi:uncharacterized protein (TIGR02145 family)